MLEETSKLTSRYQTTIPSGVRKALDLKKGDRIRYRFENGRVYIEAVRPADDPALAAFLNLIERDIVHRPEAIRPLDEGMREQIGQLVADIEIDLDTPLHSDDEEG